MEVRDLITRFGADTSDFEAGKNKMKQHLTELNRSLLDNQNAVKAVNAEIKALEKQQKELAAAMVDGGTEEQKRQMQELTAQIDALTQRKAELKTEEQSLRNEISATNTEMKKQGEEVKSNKELLSDLKTELLGISAAYAAVVTAMFGLTAQYGAQADDINTNAKVTGLLTSEIQKFNYAADLIDVSFDTMSGALVKLKNNMQTARDGTKQTQEAFERLGVKYKDSVTGELLDGYTTLNNVINALGKVENATERDTIAVDLLGKSAAELNPLILGGADALKEIGDEAERMGYILDQTTLDKLNEFNDKIDAIKAKAGGVGGLVAAEFTDSFDMLFEKGNELLDLVQQAAEDGTLESFADDLATSLDIVAGSLGNCIKFLWENKDAVLAVAVAMGTFKMSMTIGSLIANVVMAMQQLKTANDSATISQIALNTAMKSNPYVLLASIVLSAVAAITTFGVATNMATDSVSDLTNKVENFAEQTKTATEEQYKLDDVIKKYEEIESTVTDATTRKEQLSQLQETLNNQYEDEAAGIDLVNGSYEEQIGLLQQLTEEEKAYKINEATTKLNEAKQGVASIESSNTLVEFSFNTEKGKEALENEINAAYQEIDALFNPSSPDKKYNIDFLQDTSGKFNVFIKGTIDEQIGAYQGLQRAILDSGEANGEFASTYQFVSEKVTELTKLRDDTNSLERSLDVLNGTAELTEEEQAALSGSVAETTAATEKAAGATSELSEELKNLITNTDTVRTAISTLSNGTALSYEETQKLIAIQPSLYDSVTATSDGYYIEIDALTALDEAMTESARVQLQTEIDKTDATIAEIEKRIEAYSIEQAALGNSGDIYGAITKGKEILAAQNEITALKDQIAQKKLTLAELNNPMHNGGTTSSGGSTSDKYADEISAYKTLADYKISKIKEEMKLEEEKKNSVLADIDEEIQARKRLNEDTDMQEQMDKINAELQYAQLDDFSRGELEKKLADLQAEKEELDFSRSAEERKTAAQQEYEDFVEVNNATIDEINKCVETANLVFEMMKNGITSITENRINTYQQQQYTNNFEILNTSLSSKQIAREVVDMIMKGVR